jgi:hypothetical protein
LLQIARARSITGISSCVHSITHEKRRSVSGSGAHNKSGCAGLLPDSPGIRVNVLSANKLHLVLNSFTRLFILLGSIPRL